MTVEAFNGREVFSRSGKPYESPGRTSDPKGVFYSFLPTPQPSLLHLSTRRNPTMLSMKTVLTTSLTVLAALCLLPRSASAQMPRTPSPEGAMVYIISPQDGATVSGDVTVRFGLKGMGIAPAGIDFPDTGHYHLFVNVEALPPLDQPIPSDDHHLHFGKGQTETTLHLEPGTYTLQLVLGDKNHVPHDPPVISEKITITVK